MHPLDRTGLVVSHNVKHLALLLPDHLVKRDTRLVVGCVVDGSARCPIFCFGQYMVEFGQYMVERHCPQNRQSVRIHATLDTVTRLGQELELTS